MTSNQMARASAGARANTNVVPVDREDISTDVPSYEGERCHWETRGGTWIRHPSAYGRKGRSNMVYVHTTLRVEVSTDWLELVRKARTIRFGSLVP